MGENAKNNKKRIEHWEVISILLMFYDFLAVAASYFAALWIRFDCQLSKIDARYLLAYSDSILIYAGFCVVVFCLCGFTRASGALPAMPSFCG